MIGEHMDRNDHFWFYQIGLAANWDILLILSTLSEIFATSRLCERHRKSAEFKVAIIACARKLLIRLNTLLKNQNVTPVELQLT